MGRAVGKHLVPACSDRVRVAVDVADGDPAGSVLPVLAILFGRGGLGQQHRREPPGFGYRQPGPRAASAIRALAEVNEYPCDGVDGAPEREPPDGQVAPA